LEHLRLEAGIADAIRSHGVGNVSRTSVAAALIGSRRRGSPRGGAADTTEDGARRAIFDPAVDYTFVEAEASG
jgi:hypothetical protein